MTTPANILAEQLLAEILAKTRIVMVNTTLPANIGSAARAMHTMGFSDLVIVNPKHPIDEESISHAAGGLCILKKAKIAPSLSEALADCQLVFAASSRSRHIPRPVVTPNQAGNLLYRFMTAQLSNHSTPDHHKTTDTLTLAHPSTASLPQTAIIFGREDRGLTNEELACADYHIQITANPDYPVLNVASAIQVITAFIYDGLNQQCFDNISPNEALFNPSQTHSTQNPDSPYLSVFMRQQWDEPAITHDDEQQLVNKIIELMSQIDLANTKDLKSLPQRLTRLTSRLQLDKKEHQIINAIIGKIMALTADSTKHRKK